MSRDKRNKVVIVHPNQTVLYRIVGTVGVSAAGAESSFSKLKLMKNY